jgi:hypothetical protein
MKAGFGNPHQLAKAYSFSDLVGREAGKGQKFWYYSDFTKTFPNLKFI